MSFYQIRTRLLTLGACAHAVWQATGREEQSRLYTSSWLRRPCTWTVSYSCPQYGIRSWTLPDQSLDCPECVLVGPCPPNPMIIIITFLSIVVIPHYYYYSRPVTYHLIKHSWPSYDIMVAVYIRPNHLFLQHCNWQRPSQSKRHTFQSVSTATWLLNNCPAPIILTK